MGWVGSVATVRGIQLMREVKSGRHQEKKLSKVSEPLVEKEEKEEKAE
jgi:hypothetical protein